jgi:hypothetical protein
MKNGTDLGTVLSDFGWKSFKSTDTDRYYRHPDHPGHVIWRRHPTGLGSSGWGPPCPGRPSPRVGDAGNIGRAHRRAAP